MKELVARRYVKALVQSFGGQEIASLLQTLQKVRSAFADEKFCEIIAAPYVSDLRKVELVLQIVESSDSKIQHLIRLLGEKNRFAFIPEICAELEATLAAMNKEYVAVLSSKETFDEATLENIKNTFAKKLNVNLALKHEHSDTEGVRLVVEDLGVEVAFSQERFVSDLREHILRAF